MDAVTDDEEGGLLGSPDVGRLGDGTLAPDMFRRFEGFGGVKAENVPDTNTHRFRIHLSTHALPRQVNFFKLQLTTSNWINILYDSG